MWSMGRWVGGFNKTLSRYGLDVLFTVRCNMSRYTIKKYIMLVKLYLIKSIFLPTAVVCVTWCFPILVLY